MNWRTNEMLKSEYFADIRTYVASDVTNNKQRVCGCGLYQISAGGPSHPWQSHGLDYTALMQ